MEKGAKTMKKMNKMMKETMMCCCLCMMEWKIHMR